MSSLLPTLCFSIFCTLFKNYLAFAMSNQIVWNWLWTIPEDPRGCCKSHNYLIPIVFKWEQLCGGELFSETAPLCTGERGRAPPAFSLSPRKSVAIDSWVESVFAVSFKGTGKRFRPHRVRCCGNINMQTVKWRILGEKRYSQYWTFSSFWKFLKTGALSNKNSSRENCCNLRNNKIGSLWLI